MDIIREVENHLNNEKEYNSFFNIYSFTNENISSYIPFFDLKNKSLLTVGSSCDQVLNASYSGCEDITVCDVCSLTKYYYYLKLASLLELNRDEFLKFLCETYNGIEKNPYLLNKRTFNKIKNTLRNLDYDSYYLWIYLLSNYDINKLEKIFRNDINIKKDIIYCNEYLKSDKNFKHLKSLIMNTKVNFINGNVVNEKYDRLFDNIWLSNVAHYLTNDEINNMFLNNEKALSINGKMLLCYLWNKEIYFNKELNKYITERIILPGSNIHEDNSILIYKKTL